MKKILFIFTFVFIFALSNVAGVLAAAKPICSKIYRGWTTSSLYNNKPFTIQACVLEKNNSIFPYLIFTGPPNQGVNINLYDDTKSKAIPVSSVYVYLNSMPPLAGTVFGKSVTAIGLHRYHTEVVAGPYDEGPTWVLEGKSSDLNAPLLSPALGRYNSSIFKVNGKGSYR